MSSTFTISQQPSSINLYLYPDGDSACTMTPVTGSDNYAMVDETWHSPDEDTTHVESTVTYKKSDKYTIDNPSTSTSGTINWVRVITRGRAVGHGQNTAGIYQNYIEDSTTTNYGDDKSPIGISYANYSDTYTKNPSGSDWTWATLKDLEIGMLVSSPSYGPGASTNIEEANAAGAYNECATKESAASAGNYQSINTDDDGVYIYTGGGYKRDIYNFTESGTYPSGYIEKVVVKGKCKSPETGGNCRARGELYIGGAIYGDSVEGEINNISSSWTNYDWTWEENPSTGGGWSSTDFAALQFGIRLYVVSGTNETFCSRCSMHISHGYDAPDIRVTQAYAIVNYTPSETTVTLTMPNNMSMNHSRRVSRHTFYTGDYEVDDYGRSSKTLTLTGLETSSATSRMQSVKDMVHYGAVVTLAGLPDSNLNTEYHIVDFSFQQEGGEVDIYRWNLTLEED